MPTKVFASMGLSLCGLIFISLVFIMYLSKKKFRGFENNVFLFMLILTFLLHIDEFLYIYAMYNELDGPNNFINTNVFCYIFLLGGIIWFCFLILYIWAIGKKNVPNEIFKKDKKRIITFLAVLATVVFIMALYLPIEYPASQSNLYVFAGPSVYTLYVIGGSALLLVIFSVFKKGAAIPSQQKKPIYFSVALLLLINLVQVVFDLDYNSLIFIFTFVITTLYFTIESQDYKLVDDLEKRRVESIIADKAQTEFLTNMSHEIRTPLNTILGFSDSLLEEKTLTKELLNTDVKMIYSASKTLLLLINNILDISRIESGKEVIEEKDYNLKDIILDLKNNFSSKYEDNNTTVLINNDNNIPSVYHGDSQKIYKILFCVINNAMKYTNFGNITLNISGTREDTDSFIFKFSISNSGHDMSYENFSLDFNDFVKLGTDNQNNIDSAALGLIVAKKLIEMLDGEIEFINKPGQGTKYIVTIKQKIVDNDKIGKVKNPKDSSNNKKINCSGKKALIVDDNALNLKLSSRLLSEYKFEIDTASNGNDCIEKVCKNKYDIIFLDHMMPELDGIETLNILKEKVKKLPPVIALTANSSTGLKEKYISLGFYEYLSKPINTKSLNKLITKIFKEVGGNYDKSVK